MFTSTMHFRYKIDKESSIKYVSTIKTELSTEETEKIQGEVNKAYGTEANEILILALALALS